MGDGKESEGEGRPICPPSLPKDSGERGGRARKEGNPANGPMHGRPTHQRAVGRSLGHRNRRLIPARSDGVGLGGETGKTITNSRDIVL